MANLDWPGFGIRSIQWTLDRPAQVNRSAYTGKRTAVVNPWHGIWKVHVDLATLQGDANFRSAKAFFAKLKGQINSFRLPATEGAQGSGTILGLEMVTNGTFDTNTSGWSAGNGATLSAVGGRLRVAAPGATYGPDGAQSLTTVIGASYTIVGDNFSGTAGAPEIWFGPGGSPSTGVKLVGAGIGLSATWVATSTSAAIAAISNSTPAAGQYVEFDNISVKQVVTKPQLTANAAQGATSFTISTNPGLTEGMMMTAVLPSGNEQLLLITSVSGTTIGFEPALREAMVTGNSVEVTSPWCQVALADSIFGWNVESWRRYGASFDAEEVF